MGLYPPVAAPGLAMALLVGLSLQIGAMAGPVSVTRRQEDPTFDTAATQDKLTAKKAQITQIVVALEGEYENFKAGRSLSQCFSGGKLVDGCGNELPASLNPTCSEFLGDTKGCECRGKKTVEKVAVKAIDSVLDPRAQRKAGAVGCFAAGTTMDEAYKKVSGAADHENKLMYFGSVDGVMAYYPGVLWARSKKNGATTCGQDYDPRKRPWFLSGSTGPKNVVFILDSSGSMQQPVHAPRMALLKTAAKALMDGLTQADFVSVVDFDGEARTFKDNKFMARATKSFRGEMKNFIDGLEAKGSTNYEAAFTRAFEIVDTGYSSKYETGCQTVFVFLTDGKKALGADPTSMITTRKAKVKRNEMYLIIGLGSVVENDDTLKNLACAAGGIFESVSDPASNNDADVRKAESALSDALAGFSRYFHAANAIAKRIKVTFSEVYEGANFPMRMTTASMPVYDKKTDPNRWRFLGVAGIDVTTCDIIKNLYEKNPTIQNCPPEPRPTVIKDCRCASDWTYRDKTYKGCTTDDWPFPWCASVDCGMPLDTVSTKFWADCQPFGANATLESMLMESGLEDCPMNPISSEALEALRRPAYRCLAASSSSATVSQEMASNFLNGTTSPEITASSFPISVSNADWALNPAGASADLGTQWSTDTTGCDQCRADSKMVPTCAKPSTCPAATEGITPLCETTDSGPQGNLDQNLIIAAVVGASSLVVFGLGALRRAFGKQQKVQPEAPVQPAWGNTPQPQQLVQPHPSQTQQYVQPHASQYSAPTPVGQGPGMSTTAGMVAGGVVAGGAVAVGGHYAGAAVGQYGNQAGAAVGQFGDQAGAVAGQYGSQAAQYAQEAGGAIMDEVSQAVAALPKPDMSALTVPPAAKELASNVLDAGVLADMGDAGISGVLAVGVAVPIVGQVRTHVHLCARAHICDVHMYGCVCLCESSE